MMHLGLTYCFCLQRAAVKGIAQVVVSRIAMAAPGMSKCRVGRWERQAGHSLWDPVSLSSLLQFPPRKKREGGLSS